MHCCKSTGLEVSPNEEMPYVVPAILESYYYVLNGLPHYVSGFPIVSMGRHLKHQNDFKTTVIKRLATQKETLQKLRW